MNVSTIHDGQGLSVDLLDYGARIVGIQFEDTQVACRYQSIEDYATDGMYLGASIGPIANRLQQGQLELLGKQLQMPRNEGYNTLHSGGNGVDKQLWLPVSLTTDTLVFKLDYDMNLAGLKGTLVTLARYQVRDGTLSVSYESICDHTAYLNLTNHVYLNLGGRNHAIDDHEFVLLADNFVNVDARNIPTGTVTSVANPLTYAINRPCDHPELQGRCDHHFNVGDAMHQGLRHLISAHSHITGIRLEVFGTSPGFQFYTGKSMAAPFSGSAGFCVETQYAPDAINQAAFYSPITMPGQPFVQRSEYRFHR